MRKLIVTGFALVVAASCATERAGTGLSFDASEGTTLSAEKTAEGQLTKTFVWTLEKTAGTDTLHLLRGDDAAVTFTLAAALVDSVNVVSVAGEVCVTNDGEEATADLQIVDRVQAKVGDGEFEDIAGATVTITPEEQVAGGAEACFPYDIPFEPVENATYRNVAAVTITNLTGSEGTPAGPEVTAEFALADDVTGEAAREITVTDSNGEEFEFDEDGEETYTQAFACDEHAGDNLNTATIVETGVTADAVVHVACYALDVAKTAETDFTRTWAWSLEKTSDTSALLIPAGFPYGVTYEVTPAAEAVDGEATVTGTITVTNPAPYAATVLEVVDTAATDLPLTVACGDVEFPVTIEPGASIACTYEGSLPDVTTRTNTATTVLQNVSFDADGAPTATGTTAFAGSAEMVFDGEPSAEYDTCVTITDDQAGELGTVCVADLPTTLTYTSTWGPFETCGEYEGVNTASFVTNDNAVTGDAQWTVLVTIPCGPNCTLSKGYWKNHSEYGPAKYDATWGLLPQGADQPFFGSGYSWLSIMRTPPRGGDAYIQLGRQYAAAWLNGLRGAYVGDVADDIQRAAELLEEWDGDPSSWEMMSKDVEREFRQIAGRLDEFNNGMVGPGHCDEDDGDDDEDDAPPVAGFRG